MLFLSQRAIEGTTTSDAIVNTVAGVIGMIPEGLVLLTSVSFILGVGRLARKQALVQEMEAIEALARVICFAWIKPVPSPLVILNGGSCALWDYVR